LAGAPPQTPLGELTALPRPPSWISGVLLLRGGEGRIKVGEGRGREREEIGRGGKGRDPLPPPPRKNPGYGPE